MIHNNNTAQNSIDRPSDIEDDLDLIFDASMELDDSKNFTNDSVNQNDSRCILLNDYCHQLHDSPIPSSSGADSDAVQEILI